jgi:tetratricopeptide (TPR) repeat protein
MRELKIFQEKIEAYRTTKAPKRYTQKDLAGAILLDKDELSKRLNAWKYPHKKISPLTCAQVQAIVCELARWGAIQTREEARELLTLMECPDFSFSDWSIPPLSNLRSAPERSSPTQIIPASTLQRGEKSAQLRAMQRDRTGILQARLESFVGRQTELDKIDQLIHTTMTTGGYITITGPAGQGKSSIIAKLVKTYGEEATAYHFIPFNPGPDYQVTLLRHLMVKLIVKHSLPDWYITSESRPVLYNNFLQMLFELAERGKQEVLFIDGLDQLVEDPYGERDLSFLPTNPPKGITFVLGSRPNETLHPLKLYKPHFTYDLPDLSRADFDHILQHRSVILEHTLAERFFEILDRNALYLDLLAKELAVRGDITDQQVEDIVRELADDPENLFSLTINRLRQQETLWNVVIKPVLGLLLETNEPLAREHLKQILNIDARIQIDAEQLNRGLEYLGGLLVTDEYRRYTLFHLKFRGYLRQNPKHSNKIHLFDTEDEQHLHQRFVDWCERGGQGGLASIWDQVPSDATEQGRRHYACQHYISHLFGAKDWQKLFRVLDEGSYGRAKVRHASSIRTYVLDLDIGRAAAASTYRAGGKAPHQLPRLWQYTLLRWSLAGRADDYPVAAFHLMLLLGQETKALELAELLTKPDYRVQVFLCITRHLIKQTERDQELEQMPLRTEQIIRSIPSERSQAGALMELGSILAQAGNSQEAKRIFRDVEQIISTFFRKEDQARKLTELSKRLAQEEYWQDAERVIHSLSQKRLQAQALIELGRLLAQAGYRKDAERIWQEAEHMLPSLKESGIMALTQRKQNIQKGPIWSHALVSTDLARALIQAERWQDAERVTRSISSRWSQAETLTDLGSAFVQVQRKKDAERVWEEARRVSYSISSNWSQARALTKLGKAFAQVQRWQDAKQVWRDAELVASSTLFRGSIRPITNSWEIKREIFILSSEWRQARVLIELGSALALAKRWQDAERVWQHAEQIIRFFSRKEGQARIALIQKRILALAESRQTKQLRREAKLLIRITSSEWSQARALTELGSALARAERWQDAERIIGSISHEECKVWAQTKLGNILVETGRWQDAERVIHSISKEGNKVEALTNLASRLVQAGQRPEAERIWRDTEQLLFSISYTKEGSKARALITLGNAIVQAQDGQDAERVWQEAERILFSLPKGRRKVEALTELSSTLAQARHWQDVERVIHFISKEGSKAEALIELGSALAQEGRWQEAERVWQDTKQLIIHLFSRKECQVWALTKLGGALAQAERRPEAERVWRDVEQRIRSFPHHESQTWALTHLGDVLAHAKLWQEAERIIRSISREKAQARALVDLSNALAEAKHWQDAERVIHSISDQESKVRALIGLGRAFAQAERWQEAEHVWWDAEQAIRSFSRKRSQTRMLTELGRRLAQAECWQEAERIIHSISDQKSKVWVLTELSGAFAQAERWQDAERVIRSLSQGRSKVWALTKLGSAMVHAQCWQDAERIWRDVEQMIPTISKEGSKVRALIELGNARADAQHRQDAERVWQEAEETIPTIFFKEEGKVEILYRLVDILAKHSEYDRIVNIAQREWLHTTSKDNALALFSLICSLISHDLDLGIAFYDAFTWADAFTHR